MVADESNGIRLHPEAQPGMAGGVVETATPSTGTYTTLGVKPAPLA
jgi:hypothetical protein